MPNTKRDLIIRSLLERAAEITIGNGYNTNIGENAYRAASKIDPNRLPSCVIFPLVETAERIGGSEYLCTMPVRVEAVSMTGIINPSVLSEIILGDIRQAFFGSPISSLIEEISYINGGTNDYSKNDTVLVLTNFSVKYFSTITNPYL
jgi:hypothetical protein